MPINWVTTVTQDINSFSMFNILFHWGHPPHNQQQLYTRPPFYHSDIWGFQMKKFHFIFTNTKLQIKLPTYFCCIIDFQWCGKSVNTLRLRRNGHFADDIFKRIFFNENVWISIKISLNFVPKGPVNNIPALVQIMAGRRPGDEPLSEPMMDSLLTHIGVTRPQWVKKFWQHYYSTDQFCLIFHCW